MAKAETAVATGAVIEIAVTAAIAIAIAATTTPIGGITTEIAVVVREGSFATIAVTTKNLLDTNKGSSSSNKTGQKSRVRTAT